MSLSAQYKQYTKRTQAQGKQPVSFDKYQSMAAVREQRGNGSSTSAVAIVEKRQSRKSRQQHVQAQPNDPIAQLQAQLDALRAAAVVEPEVEAETRTFVIADPDSLATGRQLWKLNELGLLNKVKGQLTKGNASAMLDSAINA